MSERIRRLELIGHATWPSLEDEWLNGWLLRAAQGVTRRANSASPVYHSDDAVEAQVSACEEWFARRGLPSIFRLTPMADPAIDEHLSAAGYQRDPGAAIMTRPIRGFPAVDHARVAIAADPSELWLDLMAEEPGRGGARRGVLRTMLGGIAGRAGFAGVEGDGRMEAIGLGVVADAFIALYLVRTAEERRRRGLATAVTGALLAWGRAGGAEHAFLQVHPLNAPARSLYGELGFEHQYEYWYREPSQSK